MNSRPLAPDCIDTVIAFRFWRIMDGHLYGPFYRARWEPGDTRAECHFAETSLPPAAHLVADDQPHTVPGSFCRCGLYANHLISSKEIFAQPLVKMLDRALDMVTADESAEDGWEVFGAVAMWGRIEVHASGLRAEYARPILLAATPYQKRAQRKELREVAKRYGAGVVRFPRLERTAFAFGSPVPKEFIPVPKPPFRD